MVEVVGIEHVAGAVGVELLGFAGAGGFQSTVGDGGSSHTGKKSAQDQSAQAGCRAEQGGGGQAEGGADASEESHFF